jgi:MoaA/NifB/PqqE/SkfB family radical SAM enzyme
MKTLSLHVTDLCNEKCTFCVVGSPLYKRDTVRYADLARFLVENSGCGFEVVNLHGGEPTIHPRLFDLLDVAKLFGYPAIQLQTNARRLKDPAFVARLTERNVSRYVVSLHGSGAGIQDLLTQTPGGFDETIEGIRNVKAAGARVQVNTVLTRTNMAQLESICRLCLDLSVEQINISNLHPVGSGYFALDQQAPSVAETRRYLMPAVEEVLAAGYEISLEGFPLCVVTPYERLAIEDGSRSIRMMYHGEVHDSYDDFMDAECRSYGSPCEGCALRSDCGGVYVEYSERRGWAEFGLADLAGVAGVAVGQEP